MHVASTAPTQEIDVINLRYMALGASFMLLMSHSVSAQTGASPASDASGSERVSYCDGYDHTLLRNLYKYALMAELAYRRPSEGCLSEACTLTNNGKLHFGFRQPNEEEKFDILKKFEQISSEQRASKPTKRSDEIRKILEENWDSKSSINEFNFELLGDGYLTCGREQSYEAMLLPIQIEEGESSSTTLAFQYSVVVPSKTEETLKQNRIIYEKLTVQNHEILAIPGTELINLLNILPSLNYLRVNFSCVYEAAVAIAMAAAQEIKRGKKSDKLVITGHSLGGSIAQYIANRWGEKWKENKNLLSPRKLTIYSFNSIGIYGEDITNTRLPYVYSYFVDGEIAGEIGSRTEKTQLGKIIKFVPPSSNDRNGWKAVSQHTGKWWNEILSINSNSVLQIIINQAALFLTLPIRSIKELIGLHERVKRHEIATVKRSLCDCMNGWGKIVETN